MQARLLWPSPYTTGSSPTSGPFARIPFSGKLSSKELDPIDTFNHPMLNVEKDLLQDLRISPDTLGYLHHNQRMVNRIFSPDLFSPTVSFRSPTMMRTASLPSS